MRRRLLCGEGLVEVLEDRTLLSNTWFVAPYGSDKNAGTISSPFLTIQRAANIATAGDHVEIRAGTYHETVIPKHSGTPSAPIVFEAYNGESVTLSGADPITSWGKYSGSIYDAAMPWDLGEGNNQVFVNGVMINEARFPNTSLDPSHPTLDYAQKIVAATTTATITDSRLNQPANYWKGAIIHIEPGQEWVAQTGVVTSSEPGQLTFTYTQMDKNEIPSTGNPFYLTDSFKALDTSGEWYRDPASGRLYVWTPTSNNPASDDIEVKHRDYAFDVSGQHDITIQNLNTFASTINSDSASTDLKINHISAKYLSQFVVVPIGWFPPTNTGIVLAGNNSIIENSTIAFSAGDGVYANASGVQVINNTIHDIDTSASDAAGVQIVHPGVTVEHNTIYNSGRDGIRFSTAGTTIEYNTIHDCGLQVTEAGGIYTEQINGNGSVIAYNTIYNVLTGGFGGTGIFLDNFSSGFVVHNNNVFNCEAALKMDFVCRNNNIYNNTLSGKFAVNSNQQDDWDGTKLTNNILIGKVVTTKGVTLSNNTAAAGGGRGAGNFSSGATAVSPPPSTATLTPPPPPARSATSTIEALQYSAQSGGLAFDNFNGLGYADGGDWAEYSQLNFGTGVSAFKAEIAALAGYAGSIQLRLDSPTGALIGTLKAAPTGAWGNYTLQTAAVNGAAGVHNLYLVFVGGAGVANVESFDFA